MVSAPIVAREDHHKRPRLRKRNQIRHYITPIHFPVSRRAGIAASLSGERCTPYDVTYVPCRHVKRDRPE